MISLSLLIIIMLFLLTDSPQELKLEKVHGTLIIMFYVNPSSLPLQFVLKRMLRYYLKTPPLKQILQFQDRMQILGKKPQVRLIIIRE